MTAYTFKVVLDQGDATPDYQVICDIDTYPKNAMPMLAGNDTINFSFNVDLSSLELYSWPLSPNDSAFPFADQASKSPYDLLDGGSTGNSSFTVTVANVAQSVVAAFALVGTYLTKTGVQMPFLIDPEAMVSSGH